MRTTGINRLATALTICFAVAAGNAARGSTLEEPVTFTAEYGTPIEATGTTWAPSAKVSKNFVFYTWSATIGFQFTPIADVTTENGDILTVTCQDGEAILNLSKCST